MGLDAHARRPRVARLPHGGEHLRRRLVRRPERHDRHALRGDQVPHPGDRHVGAGVLGRLVVRDEHGRGVELPDPPPRTDRCRGDERDPPRRERRGRRPRLLRRRRVRSVPRPHARRVVVRHRRRRALHAPHPRPGDRNGWSGSHRRRVQRRQRLVARRAVPVLRDRRRTGAAVPHLAARGGCRADGHGRHARLRGDRRAVLRRARRDPVRRLRDHPVGEQDEQRDAVPVHRRPDGRADPRRPAARRRRVLASITGAT